MTTTNHRPGAGGGEEQTMSNDITITMTRDAARELAKDPRYAPSIAAALLSDDAPPKPATVPAQRQRKLASAPRMAKAGRKPARIAGPVGGKMSAAESASRILSKMEPGTVYSAEVLRPLTGLGKAQFGRGMTHAINRESVTATGQKRATRYTRVG